MVDRHGACRRGEVCARRRRSLVRRRGVSVLGGAGQQLVAISVLDQALAERDDSAESVPALLGRSWLRMHVGASGGALQDAERARRLVPRGDERLLGRTLVRYAL